MKKILSVLIIVSILLASFSTPASAIELPLRIVFNGDKIIFSDVTPYTEQGVVQIPINKLLDELKLTYSISNNVVTITKFSGNTILTAGEYTYKLDNKVISIKDTLKFVNNTVYIPTNIIETIFDCPVTYEEDINTYYINTKDNLLPETEEVKGTKITLSDMVYDKVLNFGYNIPFVDSTKRVQADANKLGKYLSLKTTVNVEDKSITYEAGKRVLKLTIGSKQYDMNGKKVKMDTSAVIKNNVAYVPVTYIAEAFGYRVLSSLENDSLRIYPAAPKSKVAISSYAGKNAFRILSVKPGSGTDTFVVTFNRAVNKSSVENVFNNKLAVLVEWYSFGDHGSGFLVGSIPYDSPKNKNLKAKDLIKVSKDGKKVTVDLHRSYYTKGVKRKVIIAFEDCSSLVDMKGNKLQMNIDEHRECLMSVILNSKLTGEITNYVGDCERAQN